MRKDDQPLIGYSPFERFDDKTLTDLSFRAAL